MARTSHLRSFREAAERAYTRTYARFSTAAGGIGATVVPLASGKCFSAAVSRTHPNSIEVTGALKLEQLPFKRKASAQGSARVSKICVLLSSFDVYKFDGRPASDNSFLNHSCVRLGYYEHLHAKDRWRSLLCVRYDFGATGARDGHPIFHAQMEDGGLNAGLLATFPGIPTIEPLARTCPHTRIPTANVIGATALLSLAADHLPPLAFPPILDSITSQKFFRDWRCNCTTLNQPDSAKEMISAGWYSST